MNSSENFALFIQITDLQSGVRKINVVWKICYFSAGSQIIWQIPSPKKTTFQRCPQKMHTGINIKSAKSLVSTHLNSYVNDSSLPCFPTPGQDSQAAQVTKELQKKKKKRNEQEQKDVGARGKTESSWTKLISEGTAGPKPGITQV